VEDVPPRLTGLPLVDAVARREDDPVVGPLGADDIHGPATVRCTAVQTATEETGSPYGDARDRTEAGADEIRVSLGRARLGVGVQVACDLLAGERIEDSVTVV
jgi:hypothetical protein